MSYASISGHRSMVFDEVRNAAYARAIEQAVDSESVVLDLGAGMGILGLIAAKAGAKKVYLVEPQPIVSLAKEVALESGLLDRVEILEGKIEDLELPEKVDLIISVMTGNLLFSEDLLPSLFHARDNYLKNDGQMIPDRAELVVAPVSIPDIYEKYVGCWSKTSSQLNFQAGRRFAANEIIWSDFKEYELHKLSPDRVLSALDLTSETSADCHGRVTSITDKSEECHGILCWIRIRLGNEWLSSEPHGKPVHWSAAFLPLGEPHMPQLGEQIELQLTRPAHGEWTWTYTTPSFVQRQSSFMANTDIHRRLRKSVAQYQAKLGRQGENVLHILKMIKLGNSNQEIALSLLDLPESGLPDVESALQAVQAVVLKYGDD